jgi:hypothetical protein
MTSLSTYLVDSLINTVRYIRSQCNYMGILSPLEVVGVLTADDGITIPTGGLAVFGGINADTVTAASVDITAGTFNSSTITGTVLIANQPNITSVGPLTSLSVLGPIDTPSWDVDILGNTVQSGTATAGQLSISGGSVLNTLAVDGNQTCTGTVTASGGLTGPAKTATQSTITSVGALSALTVSGNITLGGTLFITPYMTSYYRTTMQTIPDRADTKVTFNAPLVPGIGPVLFTISSGGTYTNVSGKNLIVYAVMNLLWTPSSTGLRNSYFGLSGSAIVLGYCQIAAKPLMYMSTNSTALIYLPVGGTMFGACYQNSGAVLYLDATSDLTVTVLAAY